MDIYEILADITLFNDQLDFYKKELKELNVNKDLIKLFDKTINNLSKNLDKISNNLDEIYSESNDKQIDIFEILEEKKDD